MRKKSFYIALISILIILTFTITSFALSIKPDDRGEKVREVQMMLEDLGYDIAIDGVYGLRTKSIIKSFQSNNGLKVDGIVGDNTFEVLKDRTTDIEYEVKKGDTLSELALKYDTTTSDIKENNNLNSHLIRPGDIIYIPKTGKGGGKDDRLANNIIHEVEAGDALSLIAKRYGTDVETIKLANNLKSNRIRIGENLVIPYMENMSGGSFRLAKGAFIWPVMGRISSYFGWRIHPIRNVRAFHSGLDIAIPLGKEIRAAASGKVVQSGWINGFGKTVTIEHGNDVQTLYAHNSRLLVRKGSYVKVGDIIALAGSTGLSTGSHLHFGILVDDEAINPIKYLP